MERPRPWMSDREWLNRWREIELVRPHRQRVDEFRETILHHEEDQQGRPYCLEQASRLRVGQLVLVQKHQRGSGLITVARKVKQVRQYQGRRRVFVSFVGPISPTLMAFEPYATVRTVIGADLP